jgi:hypothetical protein
VVITDRDITDASRAELSRFRREVVSFVFQTFNLFPTLTALENVQCGAEIARRARDARDRRKFRSVHGGSCSESTEDPRSWRTSARAAARWRGTPSGPRSSDASAGQTSNRAWPGGTCASGLTAIPIGSC